MTTRTSTKMPRLSFGTHNRFSNTGTTLLPKRSAFVHHRQPAETHKLPGIGTYVIDTPKDPNLSAREKCFRYQEIHRGVSRSKLKTLPGIPKRHGMKTLPIPVATLQEARTPPPSRAAPCDAAAAVRETSDTPAHSETGSQDEARMDRARRPQDSPWKLPSQEELVSRSPIGRIVHTSAEAAVTGFGVRKSKTTPSGHSSKHREFTYLSTNLALSEPEPAVFKATERELESQAEYRKQLTFYLNQMLNSEESTPQLEAKSRSSSGLCVGDGQDETKSRERTIPYDSVGHTSKDLQWKSNIRLGEILINKNNITPDSRERLKLDGRKISNAAGLRKENNKPLTPTTKASRSRSGAGASLLYKSGSIGDLTSYSGANNDHCLKDSAVTITPTTNNRSQSNQHSGAVGLLRYHTPPLGLRRSNSLGPGDVAGARRATVTVTARSSNRVSICHLDEDGEEYCLQGDGAGDEQEEDERWMEVVNTPVVETGVYDRFANVKLPAASRGAAVSRSDCKSRNHGTANRNTPSHPNSSNNNNNNNNQHHNSRSLYVPRGHHSPGKQSSPHTPS